MLILQAPFYLVSLLRKPDGRRARPVSRHWVEEYTCRVVRCNTYSIWKPAPRGSCLQFLGIILRGAEEIMNWSNLVLFFSPLPLWYPTPSPTQRWSVPLAVKEVALCSFKVASQLPFSLWWWTLWSLLNWLKWCQVGRDAAIYIQFAKDFLPAV